MTRASTRLNGIDIHYSLSGRQDGPALLLVHPLAVDRSIWGYQLPLLGAHFRVLTPDLRGHGKSGAPVGSYDLETMASDLAALLDHLKIARTHVLGLSIGGMIAQAFALNHAGKLDRLVLSCTQCALPEAAQSVWEKRIAEVTALGVESQLKATIGRWFSADFIARAPATVAWVESLIRATPAAGYIGSGRAIQGLNFKQRLRAIKAPTLVIAGGKDPGATPADAHELCTGISGAKLHIIEDALHLCNIEKPHAFNEVALAFLKA